MKTTRNKFHAFKVFLNLPSSTTLKASNYFLYLPYIHFHLMIDWNLKHLLNHLIFQRNMLNCSTQTLITSLITSIWSKKVANHTINYNTLCYIWYIFSSFQKKHCYTINCYHKIFSCSCDVLNLVIDMLIIIN